MISELDFKIRYIKGKGDKLGDALSRLIQVNHIAVMNSYGIDLHDWILHAGQQDFMYMKIFHRLDQCTGTCIGSSTCIYTGSGTCTGTCAGAQDVDYHLMTDGLARFRDRTYVPDNSKLKKGILR